MKRVVAGFHTRNDEWILPLKLATLSTVCEAIIVCLDRPTLDTWNILDRYPKVRPFVHANTHDLPDDGPDGPVCEEGLMRAETFARVRAYDPYWILLGDTDEIFTPDIAAKLVEFETQPYELYALHSINLWGSERAYIAGTDCIYSPDNPRSNKKGAILRYQTNRVYWYDEHKIRHCPIEPQITGANWRAIVPEAPRVVHYKWLDLARWNRSPQSKVKKYQDYLASVVTAPVPESWLWHFDSSRATP